MSKSDLPTDAAQLAECRGTIALCNRREWFRDVDRQTLPNGRNKNTNIWESQAFSFPPPSSSFQVQRLEKMSSFCSIFFCPAPHSSRTPSPPHRASHGTNAGAVERQRPRRRPRPCTKWREQSIRSSLCQGNLRISTNRWGKSGANSQPNIKITSNKIGSPPKPLFATGILGYKP